jgi:predicted DNA-binding transcriptional regulator AlpA
MIINGFKPNWPANDKLLSMADLKEFLGGIQEGWVYGRIREGLLPKPIHLGKGYRSSRWRLSEIQAVVDAHAANLSENEIKSLVNSLVESRNQVFTTAKAAS